ncbi:MAG: hypothetical protein ACKV2U_17770 [Bryobacteraceae bacterium]
MRTLVALFAIGHGIAHLPGFLVAWRLRTMPELPYRTTIFAGLIEIGDLGARMLGGAWLLAAAAFGVVAVGMLLGAPWTNAIAIAAIVFSMPLCVTGWPDTRFGIAANIALAASAWFGWAK